MRPVLPLHPGQGPVVQTGGRIFSLWQKKDTLYYDGVEEAFLIRFSIDEFGRDPQEIDHDPVIHSAVQTTEFLSDPILGMFDSYLYIR
jgi:hypothetical protein